MLLIGGYMRVGEDTLGIVSFGRRPLPSKPKITLANLAKVDKFLLAK